MSTAPAPTLDLEALQELRPAAQILERLALAGTPPFDAVAIAELREANRRLTAVADDPERAVIADHQLRSLLTKRCGDRRLTTLLGEVRQALLPYRRAGLDGAARVLGRSAEHHGIIDVVERGDLPRAGWLLSQSTARELGEVLDAHGPRRRMPVAAS